MNGEEAAFENAASSLRSVHLYRRLTQVVD